LITAATTAGNEPLSHLLVPIQFLLKKAHQSICMVGLTFEGSTNNHALLIFRFLHETVATEIFAPGPQHVYSNFRTNKATLEFLFQ
jgi:hypothetical protein